MRHVPCADSSMEQRQHNYNEMQARRQRANRVRQAVYENRREHFQLPSNAELQALREMYQQVLNARPDELLEAAREVIVQPAPERCAPYTDDQLVILMQTRLRLGLLKTLERTLPTQVEAQEYTNWLTMNQFAAHPEHFGSRKIV